MRMSYQWKVATQKKAHPILLPRIRRMPRTRKWRSVTEAALCWRRGGSLLSPLNSLAEFRLWTSIFWSRDSAEGQRQTWRICQCAGNSSWKCADCWPKRDAKAQTWTRFLAECKKLVCRSWYVWIRKLWEIKVWFFNLKESSKEWWHMCALCRILHDPVVFNTCYWWMCFHQSCVAVLAGESTCVAL